MKSNQKSKTVYYLRSMKDRKSFNIQPHINEARTRKNTCQESEIKIIEDEIIRIQHYKNNGNKIFIHISSYTPGNQTSLLNPKSTSSEDDEIPHSAPEGKEFKQSECFLVIRDHHIIYLGKGISRQKAWSYISKLLQILEKSEELKNIELAPVADAKKLKIIEEKGVRSIQLGACLYDLSIPKHKPDSFIQKILLRIYSEFNGLTQKDQTPDEQKNMEDLMVNLEIKLDKNTRAKQGSKNLIKGVAEDMIESSTSEYFTITTQSGEKITHEKIKLQSQIKIEEENGSINHESAWEKMAEYLEDLEKSGLLEQ